MRLRELRKRKDLSQAELGTILGVTGQTILNWENGIYEPGIEQLIKLADYFQVSIDYLVDRPNSVSQADMVAEALSKSLDSEDLYIDCTCPDFKYRFAFWCTQDDCKYGLQQNTPPKVRNVNNNKGYVCKHLLALLYGKRWVRSAAKAWLDYMRANPDLTEYYIWGKKIESDYPEEDEELDNDELADNN
jgi:transcriptional regulator with XRE-family HTH domain